MAHAVLELIWHREAISRAEIARSMGLARSTVSQIVSELLQTDLVREAGDGPSRGGRRPVVLRFDERARVIVGIDMGATHVSVALTDLRGSVLAWREVDHDVRHDPDGTLDLIRGLVSETLDEVDGARDQLLGIGLAVPAPVDPRAPTRLSEIVLPAWRGHVGLAELSDHFGVPLDVENDANLGALAELWWGRSERRDFTFIKVATGVGAGHIIDGRIYRGGGGVAGEIGHVILDPGGEECVCGNRGCLTTFVGTSALMASVRELAPDYPQSPLASGEPTLRRLVQARLEGDALAKAVIDRAAVHLGTAIAGLMNLMNPSEVVLGGSLLQVGRHLLEPLREEVQRRTLFGSVHSTEIRASGVGIRDVALGASTLVLARALERPERFSDAFVA